MSLSPDGSILAVACSGSHEVWLYGLDQEGTPHRRIPVGLAPSFLAFSADAQELLVSESGSDSLARVGLKDSRILRRGKTGPAPRNFSFTGEGGKIMVACTGGPALTILRARDLAREKDLALGGSPWGMIVQPSAGKAYVCTRDTDTLSAIQLFDLSVSATMNVGFHPTATVLSPDGAFAYVSCQGKDEDPAATAGSVAIVRLKDWIQVDRMTAGGGASDIALSPSGNFLFVVCPRAGRLDVLSTLKHERVASLSLKEGPTALQLSQSGKRAYVSLNQGGSVAMVDLSGFP
jgi:DNA-binding beta-propeller fold protein YncE